MPSNTLETAKNTTVKFDSLEELRAELGKSTEDAEHLAAFEETIDEAIKIDNKKGIIEFTEDEWRSLITNEKLPPIETLKRLLKEKIEKRTETTAETREKQVGLLGEIETRVAEVKTGVKDLADSATQKIETLKDKAASLKKYSKPGLWMLGIGLSLKLWGYKLGNWFNGLFGEKGKYDADIKKAEMEQEFIRDPEAALKKYGAEAKENIASGQEGGLDKGKELLEKVPAIAAISGIAVGLFAATKKFLPKSIVDGVDSNDGSSILRIIGKSKLLRFMGKTGLALGSLGILFSFFSENPDKAKELGDMPQDEMGKKNWWEKASALAGLGVDKVENIWGKITDPESQEVPDEEHAYLKDHPMIQEPLKNLNAIGDKLIFAYKKNPEIFEAAGITLAAILGIGASIRYGAKGIDMVKDILIKMAKFPKNHPIVLSLMLAVGIGSFALGNCIVKKNIGKEDIQDLMEGALDEEGIFGNIMESMGGRENILKNIDGASDYLIGNGAKAVAWIEDVTNTWKEKATSAVREFFVQDDVEKIRNKNSRLLSAFEADFQHGDLKKTPGLETFFGDKGPLKEIQKKLNDGGDITDQDIHSLMSATKDTSLRIFPEGGSREEGRTIQFVTVDDEGMALGPPKNICLNPALSKTSQAKESNQTVYDPASMNNLETGVSEEVGYLRGLVSELTEAVSSGNEGKQKTIMDRVLDAGGTILSFGARAFISLGGSLLEIPGDTLFGGDKDLTTNVGWMNLGGALMPVLSFSLVTRTVPPVRWITVTPIKWGGKMTMKIATHKIHDGYVRKKFMNMMYKKFPSLKIQMLQDLELQNAHKQIKGLQQSDILRLEREAVGKKAELLTEKRNHAPGSKEFQRIEKKLLRNQEILAELGKVRENVIAREAGRALPHTNINGKVLSGMKIRGRGIMVLLSVIGASYAISKGIEAFKGEDSGSYRDKSAQEILDESDVGENEIDYFGYGEASEEIAETDDTHCETVQDFEQKISHMESEYLEDFNTLFGKMEFKSATENDINNVCEAHGKRTEHMKKLIGNNKTLLTEFWKIKFPTGENIDNVLPDELKTIGLKAFMGIYRREGKFTLECMNQQDMKNILTKIKEGSQTSTTSKVIDGGMRIVPFIGPVLSGSDAIKDFKNGNVKDGLWNTGWCVGGLILDVGAFFTLGGSTAVATSARAAKFGATAVKLARAGTIGAHAGVMVLGQGIQEYFDKARSESFNIDSLPENTTSEHNHIFA